MIPRRLFCLQRLHIVTQSAETDHSNFLPFGILNNCPFYYASQRNLASRLIMRHLNQEIRHRGNGISEIEGKAAMVAASKAGAERVSMERMGWAT